MFTIVSFHSVLFSVCFGVLCDLNFNFVTTELSLNLIMILNRIILSVNDEQELFSQLSFISLNSNQLRKKIYFLEGSLEQWGATVNSAKQLQLFLMFLGADDFYKFSSFFSYFKPLFARLQLRTKKIFCSIDRTVDTTGQVTHSHIYFVFWTLTNHTKNTLKLKHNYTCRRR